jgi:hypothetical protein
VAFVTNHHANLPGTHMKNIRRGFSLLALGLALGPLGCPSDPVCPTCKLKLDGSSRSATLSLTRPSACDGDELVNTHVVVRDATGRSEPHDYAPALIPLPPGQESPFTDPELYSVGEEPTKSAKVTFTFRRPGDSATFDKSGELKVVE